MKMVPLFCRWFLVRSLAAVSLAVLVGCENSKAPHESRVARGKYLVTIMSCNDCHTPFKMGAAGPEPDMTRMLSGHPEDLVLPPPPVLGDGPWIWAGAGTNTAFVGPWGVSYSANLTPADNGLGGWREDQFIASMRSGWHLGVEGSRRILPPMPWSFVGQATDEDLRAIFAYLKSIPALPNIVPPPQLAAVP